MGPSCKTTRFYCLIMPVGINWLLCVFFYLLVKCIWAFCRCWGFQQQQQIGDKLNLWPLLMANNLCFAECQLWCWFLSNSNRLRNHVLYLQFAFTYFGGSKKFVRVGRKKLGWVQSQVKTQNINKNLSKKLMVPRHLHFRFFVQCMRTPFIFLCIWQFPEKSLNYMNV